MDAVQTMMKEVDAIITLTQELFGEMPLSMELVPYGQVNIVYEVKTKTEGTLMYQLHPDKERVRLFFRGNEGMDIARNHRIPVPSVIATGNRLVPYAYVIYKKIEGISANLYEGDRGKLWRDLGLVAKRINLIGAPGFGKVGYWKGTSAEYYETWRSYVENEIETFAKSEWTDKPEPFPPHVALNVQRRIDEMRGWDFEPKLIHGDIALKNTIVDEKGDIVGIIDWDEVHFGRAPELEMAAAFAWTSPEEHKEFLAGYGISGREWEKYRRNVETVQLIKFIEYYIWHSQSASDHELADTMRARIIEIASD